MKIDLQKSINEFIKYTEKYDMSVFEIQNKQKHSLRVMEISNKIAKALNLSEDDIELATLIGLLHDIGRFEQFTQYHTFKDAFSFDHGDYGEQILQKDMRNYIDSDEYDDIIKIAVRNHNKYGIEEGLTERQLLFAKLIKDADKIDILYESSCIFWKDREDIVNKSMVSNSTMEQFKQEKLIKKDKTKTPEPIDDIFTVMAFVFDINYKPSLEIIKDEDYINKIVNRYNFIDETTKNSIEEARNIANNYIERNIRDKG